MIIKINETFYAFNRNVLIKYMEKKRVSSIDYNQELLFETPLKHLITEKAFRLMGYSDYSIFEFVGPTSITTNRHNESHTLYSVNCYTVKDWTTHTLSNTVISCKKPKNKTVRNLKDEVYQILINNIDRIQPESIDEFESIFEMLVITE